MNHSPAAERSSGSRQSRSSVSFPPSPSLRSAQFAIRHASAVAVWHSDDGGVTWSNAALVELENGNGHLMDKPAITVSWEPGPSLGYVYIAYAVVDYTAVPPNLPQNILRAAVSTDGASDFSPVTVTTDYVQFPQMV